MPSLVARSIPRIVAMAAIFVALLVVGWQSAPNPSRAANGEGFQGVVRDITSGKPIPNARVYLGDRSANANSAPDGTYRITAPVGVYDVHTEVPGYIAMYRVDQRVISATWTTADFEMIPEHPTAEQQAAIDAAFLRQRQAAEARAQQLQTTPQGNGITIATIPIQDYIGVLLSLDPVITESMVLEEKYLKGVVPAEMPPSWPAEALKAQAVAARSFAVTSNAYPQYGAQVDTTTKTQVWTPNRYATTDAAVDATRGIVASYGGAVAHTLYFAGTKDGYTRNNEEAFSGPPVAYLRGVWSPDAFGVWKGHGVGMSQHGARIYASDYGANYTDIVAHYYTGIRIENATAPPAPPKFPSPSPGAIINPIPLTLGWGSNGGEYWVQLFNWDLSLRADRSWSTDTTWYVGPLPEGLYYWRVWSRYGPGLEGDWSPFWPFTVRSLPYGLYGPLAEKRTP